MIESNKIVLPAEVGEKYDLQKNFPKVAITGFGEVDFTNITMSRAEQLVKRTGSKYLAEKVKPKANASTGSPEVK